MRAAPGPDDVNWQALWKSPAERRGALWAALPCYALIFAFPTGFFTAAANGLLFFVCRADEGGGAGAYGGGISARARWFCEARVVQFAVTVILPFVLLIVWQNAIVPAQLYRLEMRRGAAASLSGAERGILRVYCE